MQHASLLDSLVAALPFLNTVALFLLGLLHVKSANKIAAVLPVIESAGVQLAHTAASTNTTLAGLTPPVNSVKT